MKNKFFIGLTCLILGGCADSPSVDKLLENEVLMSEIQRGVQRSNANSGMVPITLDLGYLVHEKLITDASVDEIRSLTKCPNLNGIELIITRGNITHVDVDATKCVET
tara:strand:- start:288 stop:611 length:324 start_codon:yes stop_codon:yes gene_type:complete